jgi:hypothetical protein
VEQDPEMDCLVVFALNCMGFFVKKVEARRMTQFLLLRE